MRTRTSTVCAFLALSACGPLDTLLVDTSSSSSTKFSCGGDSNSISVMPGVASCLGLACPGSSELVPASPDCQNPAINALAGTCVAEFFECYAPAGTCTGENQFENGSKFMVTDFSGKRYYGPGSSDPCIAEDNYGISGSLRLFVRDD